MSSVSSCGTTPRRPRIFDSVARRVETEHAQRPVGDRRDAADHPHRRRLARAVRPEEAERLAALEVEVDPVDGDEVVEALDQTARLDERMPVAAHGLHVSHALRVCERPSSPRRRARSARSEPARRRRRPRRASAPTAPRRVACRRDPRRSRGGTARSSARCRRSAGWCRWRSRHDARARSRRRCRTRGQARSGSSRRFAVG